MHFDGKSFNDLTSSKNMYSWIVKNINKGVWNHNNKSAVRTLYDYYNKDIYFTTKDESLAYNEKLGNFTSFYSYEDLDFMLCFKDLTYQIKNNEFWKLHKGDEYTNIFGIPRDYSITLIANPNFTLDKVFDSVEFSTNGTESFEFSSFNECLVSSAAIISTSSRTLTALYVISPKFPIGVAIKYNFPAIKIFLHINFDYIFL